MVTLHSPEKADATKVQPAPLPFRAAAAEAQLDVHPETDATADPLLDHMAAWNTVPAAPEIEAATVPYQPEEPVQSEQPEQLGFDVPQGEEPLRYVGEVFRTYILAERGDELCLIDKHAAHERQLYEKLAANYGNVPSQLLLQPAAIDLSAEEKQALLENQPLLENAGLDVADFGGSTVLLRAVPADVEPQNAEDLLVEIADRLLKGSRDALNEHTEWVLHSISCRAAIKAGDKSSPQELMALAEKIPAVVAVVGPTATGKTALGVALAQQFSGEVISADSMQIYKGLDVGTAKVTPQETCGIPHHGVDILTPEKTFSVADFTALAGEYIRDITARGHLPLLVGGTGLYVQSLLYGVRFTAEKAPDGLREQLTAELEAIGPEAMYAIHPNNKVRVLRALEHYRATGKRLSEQKADSLPPERPYRSLVLGLDFPDRAALYRRIDLRVDKMLEAGLLAEAEYVWHNREAFRTAAQAIGYKEFFPYFEQTAALEACTEKLKQASRNYAKRQLTWFRHMDGVTWLDAGAADMRQTALRLTQDFLLKG